MIDATEPQSWRDLQEAVARILREVGVTAEVEKVISLARGKVSVDVWAYDAAATPPQTYIVECKKWRSRVSQSVVHSFRTIVGDSGANWGAIVCTSGFQKGARQAAEYSNVRLLSWKEFQGLFVDRWFLNHFAQELAGVSDPLIDYTEPINTRVFRKADLLGEQQRKEFRRLREVHSDLGVFCLILRHHGRGFLRKALRGEDVPAAPSLPLRATVARDEDVEAIGVPSEVLDAVSYRSLLCSLVKEVRRAIAEFDEVFGERA